MVSCVQFAIPGIRGLSIMVMGMRVIKETKEKVVTWIYVKFVHYSWAMATIC